MSKHSCLGSRNLFVLSNLYFRVYICIKLKMATKITDKMATKAYAETHTFKTCNITLKKYLNIYCDVQTYNKVGASSLLGLDKHCRPTRMRIMVNVQGKGLAAM